MIRFRFRYLLFALFLFVVAQLWRGGDSTKSHTQRIESSLKKSPWTKRSMRYPIAEYQKLPQGRAQTIPRIQHVFEPETNEQKKARQFRQQTIRNAFRRTWRDYRNYAWLADELRPLSGGSKNTLNNWSATLVDSLDTLWILGLPEEWKEAVTAVAAIDFERSTTILINVFETNIRYLGGLLSAYDLSREEILLTKAVQLGNLLYAAFDTPNHMPVHEFDWQGALDGESLNLSDKSALANIGSMSLEFTRLSQLTGDMKYYDIVQRISDLMYQQQDESIVPGLWPVWINVIDRDFATGDEFSLGGMADSAYEYIPKMHLLLGGLKEEYSQMYSRFVKAAKKRLFYRPMTKDNRDVLIPGFITTRATGKADLIPSVQHLGCFVGGMVALGAKAIGPEEDLKVAAKLADGCFWAYESMPYGIMPETFATVPCASDAECLWNENSWHEAILRQQGSANNLSVEEIITQQNLPAGFTQMIDKKYMLRPEAIESVFIMYRTTGDRTWQDKAWKMWKAIEEATLAEMGFATIEDVTQSPRMHQIDAMESFWTAETLKYLYLIFCEPDVISLDEWVFNTEAHPFLRPKAAAWT